MSDVEARKNVGGEVICRCLMSKIGKNIIIPRSSIKLKKVV